MPMSGLAPRLQSTPATSVHVPAVAQRSLPHRIGNLPGQSRVCGGRGERAHAIAGNPVDLPVQGVPKEALRELGQHLSARPLTGSELATLIANDVGRTPLMGTLSERLIGNALCALLPKASEDERKVWAKVIAGALIYDPSEWHRQYFDLQLKLVDSSESQTLKALHELLKKKTLGGKTWKDVLPAKPTVSSRVMQLVRVSRDAALDDAAPVRNGSGNPWHAALLGGLMVGGLPSAWGAREDSLWSPLLAQRLVDVAPMAGRLAPAATLAMKYPRAALATLAGTTVAALSTVLYTISRSSQHHENSLSHAPLAALAGKVAPDILESLANEVRHGDSSLDADERARRAVQSLGPAAEGVRQLWQIERHGRSDRLSFVEADLDIEFGSWLIKQVFDEPVPSGGVDMTWSNWTLPNGLRVILTPGKGDMASVQLRFGDGSGIEQHGQRGAVHFAEHLWFRRNLESAQSFDDRYMAAGVKDNAYTTHDTTVYFAEGPVDALPLILFEKSYRLARATDPISPAEFETERSVVLNEIDLRDTTSSRAYGVLSRAMYPLGHPYRISVGGRPKDLLSLQAGDMENFMRARQRPNLATLVISGDVDEDHVRDLVTDYFASIEPGNAFPPRTPDVQRRREDTREVIFDSVTTPRLYRSWNVPEDGHADLPGLMLCAGVLTRRLNDELGDAVTFGAAYVEPRQLGSQFHIVLFLRDDDDNDDHGWVGETLDSVSAQFLKEGPTEGELEGARRALISGSAWTQASSDGTATAVVHCVDRGGRPDCLNVDVQAWHDTTPERAKQLAGDWLAAGSHTLLVTPGDRPRAPLKLPGSVRHVPWDAGVPDPGLRAAAASVDRSAPPPVPPPGPLNFPVVSRTELANGLPVILAPMGKGKKARVVFSFDGGRAGDLDPDIGGGVAKAALRIVTQRAAPLERTALNKKLDDLELTVTARSMPGYSTLTLEGPSAKLVEGVGIVRDMLIDTRFPADLLDQSRDGALDVVQSLAEDPAHRSRVLMRQLVLGEQHPYAADPLGEGTEASLAAMTSEQLLQWTQRYLHPSNATVVAVGSFDSDELSSGLSQAFAAVDGARVRSRVEIPVPIQSRHPGVHELPVGQGEQSHVMLGYPVPCDGSTADVLVECIDRIIQHRVKKNLRQEMGLAYRVHSLATSTRAVRMGGFMMPVDNTRRFQALATARSVVSALVEGRSPVTQEELNLHLLNLRRQLAKDSQDPLEVESSLIAAVDLGRPGSYIDDTARALQGLTSGEVNGAVGRMATGHLTWVLAGPSARAVDSSTSSEADERTSQDIERRLQFTAMGLSQFVEIDPETGARTIHQL